MSFHVGIDLGGTRIKAVAVSQSGTVISTENISNGGNDADVWIESVKGLFDQWREAPLSIGLCAPGLAARDASCIEYMPGRMEALQGLDWTKALLSSVPVRVLNDAHAALLGEVWQGAARGRQDVAMFTLGTGVGGAILSGGRLMRGAIGRAGHLGHISLDPSGAPGITRCPAPLEDAIGNHNITSRSGGRFADTSQLLDAVARGESEASAIWSASVRALGAAMVSVINVVDPEIVVIGGGIAAAGETLFVPLRAYLDAHEWRPGGHRVTVLPAALGEAAGALGAAHFAMQFGELS